MGDIENVIIVGSGPAGYTAALYTARANLEPLVAEGFAWGGLLQQTTDVENYPGFPEGIMGPEMMQRFRDQAERFGARLKTEQVTKVELADEPGGLHTVWVDDDEYKTRSVIVSTGAEHRKLGVPGEDELSGRGVSYCATCDAAFFKDHDTLIVGGGDSAMEEAIFLAKYGRSVTIVHRRDEFRASAIMVERAKAVENIHFKTPFEVERFDAAEGEGMKPLSTAVLKNTVTGETETLEITGAFIAVGHDPQSELVQGQLTTDDEGYVVVEGVTTETSKPGDFAAGDLVDPSYRQAITAAGSGCKAALDAERYLRDVPVLADDVAHAQG
jgi:thioredoxin reductase (NADPH)